MKPRIRVKAWRFPNEDGAWRHEGVIYRLHITSSVARTTWPRESNATWRADDDSIFN